MPVTIKDVARAANVSVATASRAMNGHENVSERVRELVEAAAKALKYVPHSGARSLITRRTHTVGVLLPDLHGEFFSELIRGIDLAARRDGMHVLVSSSHGDAREAVAAIRTMRGRVDGLLLMSPHIGDEALREHLPPELPVVLMNAPAAAEGYDAITIDNYGGAADMVRHLATRGHRSIALIAGPARNVDAQERLRGYRDALAEILPDVPPTVLAGDFSEASGYRAGREVLSMGARPDAIFAANDMMAIGCLYALNEAGVSVPADIALAGFDDIPIARYVTPALTTVRVRIADMGQRAHERLAALLKQAGAELRPAAPPETLPVELVVRGSCGDPAPGHARHRRAARL